MNYNKLDRIIEKCVNYDIYKASMCDLYKYVIPICRRMLTKKEKIYTSDNKFSIDYSLNDKIRLISKFLKDIDFDLYHQFETIISSLDENGNPIVSFIYNDEKKSSKVDGKTGKVYIYLKNNIHDMFTILHEIIHCMNYYIVENYDNGTINRYQSNAKFLFNESTPIISEKLFGQWLVKNGYITQTDFNIIRKKRLESTKKICETIIVESEFVKLKQTGKTITKETLEKYKDSLDKNSIEYKILEEELEKNIVGNIILKFEMLKFPKSQKYVIAYNMLDIFNLDKNGINKFLKLQEILSDPEPKLYKYK